VADEPRDVDQPLIADTTRVVRKAIGQMSEMNARLERIESEYGEAKGRLAERIASLQAEMQILEARADGPNWKSDDAKRLDKVSADLDAIKWENSALEFGYKIHVQMWTDYYSLIPQDLRAGIDASERDFEARKAATSALAKTEERVDERVGAVLERVPELVVRSIEDVDAAQRAAAASSVRRQRAVEIAHDIVSTPVVEPVKPKPEPVQRVVPRKPKPSKPAETPVQKLARMAGVRSPEPKGPASLADLQKRA